MEIASWASWERDLITTALAFGYDQNVHDFNSLDFYLE
jgi:hypothetical protein